MGRNLRVPRAIHWMSVTPNKDRLYSNAEIHVPFSLCMWQYLLQSFKWMHWSPHSWTIYPCILAPAGLCLPCLVRQTHKGCLGTLALDVRASHLRWTLMILLIQFIGLLQPECMIADNMYKWDSRGFLFNIGQRAGVERRVRKEGKEDGKMRKQSIVEFWTGCRGEKLDSEGLLFNRECE